MVGLGSGFVMNYPLAGGVLKLWGMDIVSPVNFKRLMREGKNIGLLPGGFEEATLTTKK